MGKNQLSLYFNEAETKILKEATKYAVSGETAMIRILLHAELEKTKRSKTITFTYDLTKPIDKKTKKNKILSVSKCDFDRIQEICECVPMIPSNLVKYLIMPKLYNIVKTKKMEEKI